jgi:hypothetical protein
MSSQKKDYDEVKPVDYKHKFGIGRDKKKIQEAYKRAWQNRDFEIDKFWTRSAYFWGFIAAIFAGYIAVITSKNGIQTNMDVYLIALGLLFSIAWLLVIKGSKCWQQNWEAHIDKLEDEITGPLYKTVYRKGKTFYSVSKVNELLAWIMIMVWAALYLLNILQLGDIFIKIIGFFKNKFHDNRALHIIISVIGIVAGIIVLLVKTKSDGTGYKNAEDKDGQFIARYPLEKMSCGSGNSDITGNKQ